MTHRWIAYPDRYQHCINFGELLTRFPNNGEINEWWRHQIEAFSALLALCVGIHWSPVNSPHKVPVMRSFDVFYLRLNKRLSNRDAGVLRRHRVQYDVTEMILTSLIPNRFAMETSCHMSRIASVNIVIPSMINHGIFSRVGYHREQGSWGLHGADRTQVCSILAPWTLLSGIL